EAQLGALVADVVIFLFQFLEVELLLAAIGKFDRGFLCFVLVDLFLLAGLGGLALAGFEFVGQSIDVGAAVGENALDREQAGIGVVEFFACSFGRGRGVVGGLFDGRVQFGIFRSFLDVILRRGGLRLRGVEESAVADLPVVLEGFPWPLSPGFVP